MSEDNFILSDHDLKQINCDLNSFFKLQNVIYEFKKNSVGCK